MEWNAVPECEITDAVPSESFPEPSLAPASTDGRELRRKRIADYEAAGLAKPDPFDACLVAVNADLIGIASEMGEAIKQTFTKGMPTAEDMRRLSPALNDYLKVTRQLDRLMQMQVRSAEARNREDSPDKTADDGVARPSQ